MSGTDLTPTGNTEKAACVCGTALRLCQGCDDARCYGCVPYGTTDCDAISYPPAAEEVPA